MLWKPVQRKKMQLQQKCIEKSFKLRMAEVRQTRYKLNMTTIKTYNSYCKSGLGIRNFMSGRLESGGRDVIYKEQKANDGGLR